MTTETFIGEFIGVANPFLVKEVIMPGDNVIDFDCWGAGNSFNSRGPPQNTQEEIKKVAVVPVIKSSENHSGGYF